MVNLKSVGIFFSLLCCLSLTAQETFPWEKEIVTCKFSDSLTCLHFMQTKNVFEEKWSDLPQPKFWRKIMVLSPDSCLINVGATRQIITQLAVADWNKLSDDQKAIYRDSVRIANGLDSTERIFMTHGKKEFYRFDKVVPILTQGIEDFKKNGVDPWYAQAILLIESPSGLAKSSVGAYGPFQLMPAIARKFGLIVSSYTDERKNFDRSAYAASQLIKTICIPEAERILNQASVAYSKNDLWFRLFVLHVYHAGALNVEKVVQAIHPTKGGQELITQMWQTKAGGFGNASQNYTQLALASLLVLSDLLSTI